MEDQSMSLGEWIKEKKKEKCKNLNWEVEFEQVEGKVLIHSALQDKE